MRPDFASLMLVAILAPTPANSDEVVRTTDGRSFLLRSDGTYSAVEGLGPTVLGDALATATTYATDKGRILVCLEQEPDGPDQMRNYFAEDELKTRSSWLKAGGSQAEWSQVESAFKQPPGIFVANCNAIIDGWARLEKFSWPLSYRSPFKEMDQ